MFDYTSILPILITMAAVICLGGASLLFLRGRNNRSRRLLASIMLAWGIFYVIRIVGMLMGNQNLYFTKVDIANVFLLTSGNLYLIILLLYPLEIVRPGWLNLKRTGLLLLPYIGVTLFYYFVLSLLGQKPLILSDINQFMKHIGQFNVWFRILMTLSIAAYLAYLFRLTWRYKEFYQQWCRNNYSDDETMNISWLRQYGIGVVLIGVAYFGVFSTETHTVLLYIT